MMIFRHIALALALVLALGLPVAASEPKSDPHEKAAPAEAGHAAPPVKPAEGNGIVSSNLVAAAAPSREKPVDRRFQILLQTGQKLRQQKSYSQARSSFVTVLENDAGESLQRTALLELALMAQEQGELARAQQIFTQYIRTYHDDPSVAEVLLRQGLLYRQMGVPSLALVKFYAVMTTSLSSKNGTVDHYQRLVLMAQTEIADTYFLQGKQEEAAEFYMRLLKLDSPDLNKALIQYKLVRCLSGLCKYPEAAAQAQDFLQRFPDASQQPEVRFLLATALKQQGQKEEAVQQVLALLKSQQHAENRATWVYWQQRAGNEIGNQFYEESNFVNALDVYSALADLDAAPSWQMPVWYQMGIVYERLQQPQKAIELYARIIGREKELTPAAGPGLKTVLEMAKWRASFLGWQAQAGSGVSETPPLTSASR